MMIIVDDDGSVDGDIAVTVEYRALSELTYRYVDPWATGTTGEERLSYTYDDNGNLTQMKTETYSGGWSETLRWDYQWNPRDQMTKASKYVNASLDGYVEYEYCLSCDGALSKRLKYDDSDDLEMAWRYEYDGLNLLRMDEVYDSDSDTDLDDDLAAGNWRILESSTHRPGQLAAQLGKRVYEHTGNDATPDGYADYSYAYDAVGNVVMVFDSAGNEEFHFAQDAFGNEIEIAAFGATPWDIARADGIAEHQTGKWVDSFTGLHHFHARWYDSVVGRFVTRSRARIEWEMPYEYAANAPVKWVDTTGDINLKPIIDCLKKGGSCLADLVKAMCRCKKLPAAGKHSGAIQNLCKQTDKRLSKSIQSTAATIARHLEKMGDYPPGSIGEGDMYKQISNQLSLLACMYKEVATRKAAGTWTGGDTVPWKSLFGAACCSACCPDEGNSGDCGSGTCTVSPPEDQQDDPWGWLIDFLNPLGCDYSLGDPTTGE